jgi:hypothetical protein
MGRRSGLGRTVRAGLAVRGRISESIRKRSGSRRTRSTRINSDMGAARRFIGVLLYHPSWPGDGTADSELFIKSTQFVARIELTEKFSAHACRAGVCPKLPRRMAILLKGLQYYRLCESRLKHFWSVFNRDLGAAPLPSTRL